MGPAWPRMNVNVDEHAKLYLWQLHMSTHVMDVARCRHRVEGDVESVFNMSRTALMEPT